MGNTDSTQSVGERLQKVLARAGVASRRECELLIQQGRVTVDGGVVRELGTRVDPDRQQITLDGERIQIERPAYYLLNKPRGFLTTNFDPAGRPRALDLLSSIPQRLFSVGRLDKESEGLLLLTNDGELSNRLAHPRYGVPKTYVVQVAGHPTAEDLEKMRRGVHLSEGKVSADSARKIGSRGRSTLLEIVLSEGRYREIRRMLARLGHKVMRLRRTRIGPLSDAGLEPGRYRKLRPEEVRELREWAEPGRGKRMPSGGRPTRPRRARDGLRPTTPITRSPQRRGRQGGRRPHHA